MRDYKQIVTWLDDYLTTNKLDCFVVGGILNAKPTDGLWDDVSNILNKRVYVDIYTEHMHLAFGKATFDSNHLDRLERHRKDNVDGLYHSAKMVQKRTEDAKKLTKLTKFINNYEA